MDDFGDWLLAAYVGSLVILTAAYGTMSRWWSNPLGKLFLFEHLVMLAIMAQVLVTTVLGKDYTGRFVVRNVLYGSATVAVLVLAALVLVVQAYDRMKRRAEAAEADLATAEEAVRTERAKHDGQLRHDLDIVRDRERDADHG